MNIVVVLVRGGGASGGGGWFCKRERQTNVNPPTHFKASGYVAGGRGGERT